MERNKIFTVRQQNAGGAGEGARGGAQHIICAPDTAPKTLARQALLSRFSDNPTTGRAPGSPFLGAELLPPIHSAGPHRPLAPRSRGRGRAGAVLGGPGQRLGAEWQAAGPGGGGAGRARPAGVPAGSRAGLGGCRPASPSPPTQPRLQGGSRGRSNSPRCRCRTPPPSCPACPSLRRRPHRHRHRPGRSRRPQPPPGPPARAPALPPAARARRKPSEPATAQSARRHPPPSRSAWSRPVAMAAAPRPRRLHRPGHSRAGKRPENHSFFLFAFRRTDRQRRRSACTGRPGQPWHGSGRERRPRLPRTAGRSPGMRGCPPAPRTPGSPAGSPGTGQN